jgi:predicted GNAT family acetyltransferase
MSETPEITYDHDEERQTFDAIIGNQRATLEYRSNKEGKIFLSHTEVPPNLQGQGIGSALVKHVFDYIRENNMRIIPVCPFVKAYLRKHPDEQKLIASGIRLG